MCAYLYALLMSFLCAIYWRILINLIMNLVGTKNKSCGVGKSNIHQKIERADFNWNCQQIPL